MCDHIFGEGRLQNAAKAKRKTPSTEGACFT